MAPPPTTHPSVDILHALCQGKLDAGQSEDTVQHLTTCDLCGKFVTGLAGPGFLERLRAPQVETETQAPASSLPGLPQSQQTFYGSPTPIHGLPPELAKHEQYEVIRELGRGGMGVVYLARHKIMDRFIVLKLMNQAILDRPGAVDRFLREIRSAARLSHRNIVSAHDALRLGDLIIFAMEYVEGEDLATLVRSTGPLPVAQAADFIQQTALGLQHAFEKGMVHRDIKPQNIIRSKDGKNHIIKILDFGLAKATREGKVDFELTGTGQVLGTPHFMAPEQFRDASKADIRADIYGLGCTLHYLLTGATPFAGDSLYELMYAHQSVEPRAAHLIRAEVPEKLGQVVARMLTKDPAQRYQQPIEVAQALQPFVETPSAQPTPSVPGPTVVQKRIIMADDSTNIMTTERQKQSKRRTNNGWLLGLALVGFCLVLLAVLSANGVFKLKTKDGSTILLENLPDDAEVIVDGDKVTIHKVGDGKPIEVRVAPGKRVLEVKKGGITIESRELTLSEGESKPITLRLDPPKPVPQDPPKKKDAGGGPADSAQQGKDFTNTIGMKLKWIEPGTFMMGSPASELEHQSDETLHKVTLTKGYYLGAHLVTQAQWEAVMGGDANQSKFKGTTEAEKKKLPVDSVSWDDCQEFCRKLNAMENRTGDRKYRLPTEAEWEYACRAGTETPFWFGATISTDQANYDGNYVYGAGKKGVYREKTTPIDQFKANPWGLYDMHGNLYQWCEDWYGDYALGELKDPQGAKEGSDRVARGGSWSSLPLLCRSAFRGRFVPSNRSSVLGFRLAVSVQP